MIYMTSIENYSNYLIYNNGDVYSIRRKLFLKPRLDKNGYKRVDISTDDKKAKTLYIHQLVAIAYLDFILEPDSNLCIDHINNEITNNYIHNLQVITREQNIRKSKINKKSGLMRGVTRYGNMYRSIITIKKKVIILGIFKLEIDAHKAYMLEFNKLMQNVILG